MYRHTTPNGVTYTSTRAHQVDALGDIQQQCRADGQPAPISLFQIHPDYREDPASAGHPPVGTRDGFTNTPSNTAPLSLLREPEARALAGGMGRTTFRDQIRAGELPPPVKLTERISAWPAHEIESITRARVRGESRAAIRALVADLIRARGAA